MNPNDGVRREILQYFYERNSAATSKHGKKGSAVKISDAKRELKAKHGFTQQQVVSNLTYLIDRRWINTVKVEKTVRVGGGTVPSAVTWYEISALGIEKIEGESEFTPPERYAGININATGSNVIQLGDGNIVNAEFTKLHGELQSLKQAILDSNSLPESQKLDAAVDIESLKDQLAKPRPNKNVLSELWSQVRKAATIAGLIESTVKIGSLLYPLIPK